MIWKTTLTFLVTVFKGIKFNFPEINFRAPSVAILTLFLFLHFGKIEAQVTIPVLSPNGGFGIDGAQ